MAVRIRLTRVGATKRPSYRVVAIEKQRARDGRALEILGFYDPLTDPATVKLDADRIQAWISKGAQPSETVVKLMRQAEKGAVAETTQKPKPAVRARKPKRPAAEAAKPEVEPAAKPETETEPEAAKPETEAKAEAEA
ncbi:MAG: 30S ribosomal protein S16 [Chloroflexota bacterium]|nr:30S ribosomal protein S16 [Chloroflexota bacterium]